MELSEVVAQTHPKLVINGNFRIQQMEIDGGTVPYFWP